MQPDLTLARSTMESTFDSTCTISSDPQAESDDYFDDATLTRSKPVGDATAIYAGACMIRPAPGLGQRTEQEGEAASFVDVFRLRIPVSATVIPVGATVSIDSCPNDPAMVGRTFNVQQVEGGTFAVSRILTLHARARGPRF